MSKAPLPFPPGPFYRECEGACDQSAALVASADWFVREYLVRSAAKGQDVVPSVADLFLDGVMMGMLLPEWGRGVVNVLHLSDRAGEEETMVGVYRAWAALMPVSALHGLPDDPEGEGEP